MGHIMLKTIIRARDELQANPNVSQGMLLYGEGWDFGEVSGGARGANASALRLGGTGIGCFNDRCVLQTYNAL